MSLSQKLCSVESCPKPPKNAGMCWGHYAKVRKYGDPHADYTVRRGVCTQDACLNEHYGRGLCRMHYYRNYRHGTTESTTEFHGLTDSPTYRSWATMKNRCLNPNTPRYKDYGGRGIKVCDAWINSFVSFYQDMGERPPGMTLDRINTNGNYEPSNCRWASNQLQARNKRLSHRNISGCAGVTWAKRGSVWEVSISINYKLIYIGRFKLLEEAIRARKAAEFKYY